MIRRTMAAMLAVLVMGSWATAQTAARLTWKPGQVLLYRVEYTTFASDKLGDSKSETKSVLKVTKRWDVAEVDPAGVATMHMSLTSMLQERTAPSGDVLRFDSMNPDKSTPEMKPLGGYLNKPLATLRIDALGKVVEVKKSVSDASVYENDLPFQAILPGMMLTAGQSWDRAFKITLAPPLGTGEKYDTIQHFTCKSVSGDLATVTVSTELKTPPKPAGDVIPLWPMLPQGEVVFDLKAGRVHSARLTIEKELKDARGEGSETTFQSTLTVTYAGDK